MKAQRGFTLIEMLLALTIFALISLAGTQLLQGSLRSHQVSQQHSQALGDLSRLFALMEQDLRHALIPQPLIARGETAFQAGNGETVLQLVRRNWLNPLSAPRSTLQAVQWQHSQQILSRTSLSDNGAVQHFSGVERVQLRFFAAGKWQTMWSSRYSLPQVIEVTLTTARWGEIRRVFIVGQE